MESKHCLRNFSVLYTGTIMLIIVVFFEERGIQMPSGVADVEILVFICETHRHTGAVVLPCLCIYMYELKDVVAHPAFVSNE